MELKKLNEQSVFSAVILRNLLLIAAGALLFFWPMAQKGFAYIVACTGCSFRSVSSGPPQGHTFPQPKPHVSNSETIRPVNPCQRLRIGPSLRASSHSTRRNPFRTLNLK